MRKLAAVACLALLGFAGSAAPVSAQEGTPLSGRESADYASREASAPFLEAFQGGDATGLLIFILVVALIAAVVYLIMERDR